MPKVGEMAPDFEARTDSGETIRLSDFRGKRVVLYFYPKDNTPGCTAQACSFRDLHAEFEHRNAVVLGVSGDSVESHGRFKARHGLPFPLLSDPDHRIAESYGTWRKRGLLRFGFLPQVRSTFVIDEQGRIEAVHDRIGALGHGQRVLEDLG